MRCENIKPKIHDLLDNTLPAGEEREVCTHLAVCESCRSEFRDLKRVDDILRQVVLEMVSEIEVPPELNNKIEKILAERKKKSLAGRLFILLKTPAVAAVLFLTVATAGMLSFYNPFNPPVKQVGAVLQDSGELTQSQSVNIADSAGQPVAQEKEVFAADELSSPAVQEEGRDVPEPDVSVKNNVAREKVADSDMLAKEKSDQQSAFSAFTKVPQESVEHRGYSESTGFAQVFQDAADSSPALEERLPTNSKSSALQKGTLEEAAGEVGFIPARPAYLPKEADLVDVAWHPGTVYQNYRAGQVSIAISQSRADMIRFNYEEEVRQGSPVQINGLRAVLQESRPEQGDIVSKSSHRVRWQLDEWVFTVYGELPREEIIRIAASLK